MKLVFDRDWFVLQDVHNTAEELGLYKDDFQTYGAHQISEWESLPELKQLQLVFSKTPYFGRELRYFNQAPWWYKKTFEMPKNAGKHFQLRFSNVDYYCKVWMNGNYVGEHEGYSAAFGFSVDEFVKANESNTIVVKVWSPWDNEVELGKQDLRMVMVRRNMVKGTYEHSDGLLQRDVNPVGIYGEVSLTCCEDASFKNNPAITYNLNDDMSAAELMITAQLRDMDDKGEYKAFFTCYDKMTGVKVVDLSKTVDMSGKIEINTNINNISLWNTWDRGYAHLYRMELIIEKENHVICSYQETTGFRKIDMLRDKKQTSVILNGKKLYIRGTSYMPDQYVSAMCTERYTRDLLAIKQAGFNFVRVHVHIQYPEFYNLCDKLGLGIMQDSEYNWVHPFEGDFADRFTDVFVENINQLKYHPSILVWVCMNEPGLIEIMKLVAQHGLEVLMADNEDNEQTNLLEGFGGGMENCHAMAVHPGPKIFEAVRKADPKRPIIKGSSCFDDPDSGDSHNYKGSISGAHTSYLDLYGTKEKFNTEYGFDAIPCEESLKRTPRIYKRFEGFTDKIDEIQQYQYKYLKYVTEHYRLQKYSPCSGYIQFLFNDTTPVSFYGVYDWFGLPKVGLKALMESNMPVTVMTKFGRDMIDGIYAVNDYQYALGKCEVEWTIKYSDSQFKRNSKAIEIDKDCIILVSELGIKKVDNDKVDMSLILRKEGEIIAVNHYEDIFNQPSHVSGHPGRISFELGCRIYGA